MMVRGVAPHLPFFFSSLSSHSEWGVFIVIVIVIVFVLTITLIIRFYFPIALLPS